MFASLLPQLSQSTYMDLKVLEHLEIILARSDTISLFPALAFLRDWFLVWF